VGRKGKENGAKRRFSSKVKMVKLKKGKKRKMSASIPRVATVQTELHGVSYR